MLKLLGSLCIFLGGAGALTMQIRAQRRELLCMRELLAAFSGMEDAIRLERPPLPRLLLRTARMRKGDAALFLTAAAAALGRGESLPEAWSAAAAQLPLGEDGLQAVGEMGAKLCGDEECACKGIRLASKALEGILSKKQPYRRIGNVRRPPCVSPAPGC